MDSPAVRKFDVEEEVHALQPHLSGDTPLFIEASTEVVPKADASKNVDKSEDVSGRVTEKGSRVASNSALTDSNAAIAAAAASARAAVVASAVSSMTALVATAATSMHPPAFHAPCNSRFTTESTFIRGMPGRGKRMSVASVAPSGVAGGTSSFFLGYAPWPKEGPKDVEEEGNSNKLTPTTTCYTRTNTPTSPTLAGCDADRTASSRSRNDGVDSHEEAEGRREVAKGARASKTSRVVRTKKGGSLSQHPGWKTVSALPFSTIPYR